jgi:lysophospholipase L1-like esterase
MPCCKSLLVLLTVLLGCVAFVAGARGADHVPSVTNRPPFRVVCFGDSVTGDHPSKRATYQGQYLKFADLLELMLEGRLGSNTVEVINSGWAGDRTFPHEGWPGAAARVDKDVLAYQPAIAVVLVGGFDSTGTEEEKKLTLGNLETIAQKLKAAGVRTLFLLYPEPLAAPGDKEKAWKNMAANANPLIRRAAENVGVALLDLDPAMKAAAAKHPIGDLVDAHDGMHLRPRGELVYARAIFAELLKLGWLSKQTSPTGVNEP